MTSGADIWDNGGEPGRSAGAAAVPDPPPPKRTRAAPPPAESADILPHDIRFDRLSKRHRECLRGVRALKGSKEIAASLGIEKSTVDGYLTEAVRILGARNRRDAALMLGDHEAERIAVGDPMPLDPGEIVFEMGKPAPSKMGGDSARLAAAPADLPPAPSPDDTLVRQPGATGEQPSAARAPGIRLPFRRKGQRGNDLSVGDRLIWIQAIVLGIAVGFGMLMSGLQALTSLIQAMSRTLS